MSFTDPASVSLGNRLDKVVMRFVRPELFFSKKSKKPFKTNKKDFKKSIPR